MLSWDDSKLESIVSDEIYEMGGVALGPWMPAPFRLVPEAASIQTTTVEPLSFSHYSVQMSFILISDVEEVQTQYIDVSRTLDVRYILYGGRVLQQSPPTAARPLDGTSAPEEVRREDDKILSPNITTVVS